MIHSPIFHQPTVRGMCTFMRSHAGSVSAYLESPAGRTIIKVSHNTTDMVQGVPTEIPGALTFEDYCDTLERLSQCARKIVDLRSAARVRPVIIFDVDGVLNTRPGSLDSDKVQLLKDIASARNATLVTCSSWRSNPDMMNRLIQVFDGKIASATPELGPLSADETQESIRNRELDEWLSWVSPKKYVIIDDLDLFRDHWIQTDARIGLTTPHAETIMAALA